MALTRDFIKLSKLTNLFDFTKITNAGSINNSPFTLSVRTSKHYVPKFKWLRSQKVIKIPLPFSEENKKESYRTKLFKLGVVPRYWKARPMTITTAHEVFDPYMPPQGDSKVSILSPKKVMELKDTSASKVATLNATRKIKSYDSRFQVSTFPQEAQDIYVNAHTVLMKKDAEELSKHVTEVALMQMLDGIKNYTIRWKFIESIEPPKVVQVRCKDVFKRSNLFAQVTVKFHTKQCFALYDRFGRLACGSEILSKDVLEYVVFEKHINNEYGEWRLHAKIIPDWVPKTISNRTYRIEEPEDTSEDEELFIEEDYDNSEEKATTEIVESEQKASN